MTRAALPTAALAAVVLVACAHGARRPSFSGGPRSDPPAPVAAVGGTRVTKDELADFLFDRSRERWLETVDELVDERIVRLESERLGVVVPPAALDAAVEGEVAARREQLRARFGDGTDLEASVRSYYGFDVATWRRDVLRPRLTVHLALQRVARLSSRLRDQVVARVIVVADRATADAVRGKLDRGADFSLVALETSTDPSKSAGGVIPPVGRGDLGRADLEDALFAAAPGTVVGPLEVKLASGVEWHLYKVVDRLAPWTGAPATLLPRLEEDLARNPLGRAEYERWRARTRAAYGVRVFGPDGTVLSDRPGGR